MLLLFVHHGPLSSIIVLPIALYQVIFNAFIDKTDTKDNQTARYFEARAISFGIFIGTFLFFVIPITVWKFIVSD